jgi:glycosyltransferase involved in cell wall biosynthesis
MNQINAYAFLIPSYNPDENLIKVVDEIISKSDNKIFIIDDGSNKETQQIFEKLQDSDAYKNVIFLRHAINLGKGAALKTVFNHILVNYPQIEGVVTLDSDGQHSIDDCLQVLKTLEDNNNTFVLGYRTFSKDIPLKSYIGNHISKSIYAMILGKNFKDTQTGLRALSKEFMKQCLMIKSNRFEFETEQLALAVNTHINIIEVPIQTIYIENNKASSFRPLVDSFKIYFVLFRYGLSSIITALVDFIVFVLSLSFGVSIFGANMLARTVSIGVQFTLLDKYVFYSKAKIINFILFASYVYIMGILSAMTQIGIINHFNLSTLFAKILVEGILFFVNFAVLRLYIFTKKH